MVGKPRFGGLWEFGSKIVLGRSTDTRLEREMIELAGEEFKDKTTLERRLKDIVKRNTRNYAVRLEGKDGRLVQAYAEHHLASITDTRQAITGCFVKRNIDQYNSTCLWVHYVKNGVCVEKSMSSKVTHGTMKVIFNGVEEGRKLANKIKINENMRHAIDDQIKTFKMNLTIQKLVKCNSCSENVEATCADCDHAGGTDKMFNALAHSFEDSKKRVDPGFQINDHFGRNTYNLNSTVVSEWKTFHGGNSDLQILCKKCHTSKSGGETSERAKRRRQD